MLFTSFVYYYAAISMDNEDYHILKRLSDVVLAYTGFQPVLGVGYSHICVNYFSGYFQFYFITYCNSVNSNSNFNDIIPNSN